MRRDRFRTLLDVRTGRRPVGVAVVLTVALFTLACADQRAAEASTVAPAAPGDFSDYWYRGAAELTSYELEQARYGEIHRGHAVLIFVTEDFSRSKQVKLDSPPQTPGDRVPILKLNFTKNFNTGIYPYSMMTSTFTPVDLAAEGRTLKVTTTSQEWCGHTFTQLNAGASGYTLQENSYFEAEGDRREELDASLLEDGLWNLVRIDPSKLPVGSIELVPGTMFQRLSHQPWQVRRAEATLESSDAEGIARYRLEYPELDRTLTIRFRDAFPYEIESWEESYRGQTTRAVRKERTQLDYWNKNGVADETLRAELGLD